MHLSLRALLNPVLSEAGGLGVTIRSDHLSWRLAASSRSQLSEKRAGIGRR